MQPWADGILITRCDETLNLPTNANDNDWRFKLEDMFEASNLGNILVIN